MNTVILMCTLSCFLFQKMGAKKKQKLLATAVDNIKSGRYTVNPNVPCPEAISVHSGR